MRTRCRRSHRLCEHCFRVVKDFKGTINQNKLLGCVYIPNSNNFNILKLAHVILVGARGGGGG